MGWKYQDVVATLEAKRKVKSDVYFKRSKAIAKVAAKTKADPKIAKRIEKYQKVIEGFGYA